MADSNLEPPTQSPNGIADTIAKKFVSTDGAVGIRAAGGALAGPAGMVVGGVVGALLDDLYQTFFQIPQEKQGQEWKHAVSVELVKLRLTGVDLDELQENDHFKSTVRRATVIALRSHEKEKLDALKNAIYNVGTGQAADESLNQVFLEMVDWFTALHIRVLERLTTPRVSQEGTSDTPLSALADAFPELSDKKELRAIIWRDLSLPHLVEFGPLSVDEDYPPPQCPQYAYATDTGRRFLQFISIS